MPPPPSTETLSAAPAARPVMRRSDATLTSGPGAPATTDTELEWKIGDFIDDRYEVTEFLGQGGMGIVYKVHHRLWNVDMAVKTPLGHVVADRVSHQRFIREAQTWVDLGLHPNIVQCFYVRELGGLPRVFADYMAGGSLKDLVRSGTVGPGQWAHLLDLVIQACDGLAYAHDQGVVHRDVKPANLLLSGDGRLCVTDFGLVKVAGLAEISGPGGRAAPVGGCQTLTITGSEMGTPEYGAPEQWGEARHVDARADIYALGVVLFELCCGRRPFDDGVNREPPQVLIGRHLAEPVPDPWRFREDVPSAVRDLLLSCLAKVPEDRPTTVSEVRAVLVKVQQAQPGAPTPRRAPEAADLRADSLSNKGVSLWDLGRQQAAQRAWKEALQVDPHHLEASFNQAVIAWRVERQITDLELLDRLTALESPHLDNPEYWRGLGEVHLCRGAMDKARNALEESLRLDPGDGRSERLLATARSSVERDHGWARCRQALSTEHRVIRALALTADDRCLLVAEPTRLFLQAAGDLEALRTLSQRDEARDLSLTVDGQLGVAATGSGIMVWHLPSGRRVHHLEVKQLPVEVAAISGDGSLALSGGSRGINRHAWTDEDFYLFNPLRVWDLEAGRLKRSISDFEHEVVAVAMPPRGRLGAAAHVDAIRIWDLETGACVRQLRGSGHTSTLAFNTSGSTMISGDSKGCVKLWDWRTGQCLITCSGHRDAVTGVAVTDDLQVLLSTGRDGTLRRWNARTGLCERTFAAHDASANAVVLASDGQFAITGGDDALLRRWEVRFQPRVPGLVLARTRSHRDIADASSRVEQLRAEAASWLGRGEIARALTTLREARAVPGFERDPALMDLWARVGEHSDRAGLSSVWEKGTLLSGQIARLAISHDGHRALVGVDKDVSLLRLPDGKVLWRVRAVESELGSIDAVAFRPDDQLAVVGAVMHWRGTAHSDATLRLLDVSSGEWRGKLETKTRTVGSAAFTPDGQAVVFTDYRSLFVWDLSQTRARHELRHNGVSPAALALSPDGRVAFTGESSALESTLHLWLLDERRFLRRIGESRHNVSSVAIGPEGRLGLSGGTDGAASYSWDSGRTRGASCPSAVHLWDLGTGECLQQLAGHEEGISQVLILRDGRHGVSASFDKTVRFWDLAAGKCLYVLDKLLRPARAIAVTPDQRHLLVGSDRVALYEIDWVLAAPGSIEPLATAYGVDAQISIAQAWEQRAERLAQEQDSALALARRAEQCVRRDQLPMALALVRRARSLPGCERHEQLLAIWNQAGQGAVRTRLKGVWRHWFEKNHHTKVCGIGVHAPGQLGISASDSNAVKTWDLRTGKVQRSFTEADRSFSALALSKDGTLAFFAGHETIFMGSEVAEGERYHIWELPDGEVHERGYRKGFQSINAVAISADNKLGLSGEYRSVVLRRLSDGEVLAELPEEDTSVVSVAFYGEDRYAISGTQDGRIALWDLTARTRVASLEGHEKTVTSLAVCPGTDLLLSGGGEGTVCLWNLTEERQVWASHDHKGSVADVITTPDGRFGISACWDDPARLWDLQTGESRPIDGTRGSTAIALDHLGRFLVTGDFRGWLSLFELDWDFEAKIAETLE